MLRFDKATYLSLLISHHKFILSVKLSNTLRRSEASLFLEFIKIVFIPFYNFIEFIILLYTFSVIYFSLYRQHIVLWISFEMLSNASLAFTCASAIGNLWSICFWVNILIPLSFCCLSNSRIFSTILTRFFRFPFSRILFLIIAFLKSMNPSLILITSYSILSCLALIKAFTKNSGFSYLK